MRATLLSYLQLSPPGILKYVMGEGDELEGDIPSLDIYCTGTHDLKTS